MTDCEFPEACPIFGRFKLEGIKNFWIRLYCRGEKQHNCARKKLKLAGKLIPANLLPNGEYLGGVAE